VKILIVVVVLEELALLWEQDCIRLPQVMPLAFSFFADHFHLAETVHIHQQSLEPLPALTKILLVIPIVLQ
jgi:hypothetical protein